MFTVTQCRRRVHVRSEHADIITTVTTLFNCSCCSSGSSVRAQLPFIESDREDSARYSGSQQRSREGRSQGENEPFLPVNIYKFCIAKSPAGRPAAPSPASPCGPGAATPPAPPTLPPSCPLSTTPDTTSHRHQLPSTLLHLYPSLTP